MARARNIKPGFFTNADLIDCQPLARLLFAGLWTEADCRGILEDRPKTLKIKLLPGDNCDVDALLGELVERGFIRRYHVGDRRCIAIVNFGKHQSPHPKETASDLPEPDEQLASKLLASDEPVASKASSLHSSSNPSDSSPSDGGEQLARKTEPPPRSDDLLATVDGNLPTLVEKYTAIDPLLNEAWLKGFLQRAGPEFGRLPQKQVMTAFGLAHRQIANRSRAPNSEPIRSPRKFAEMVLREQLQEQAS